MKKNLKSLGLAILMGSVLLSCGTDKESTKKEKVEINFASWSIQEAGTKEYFEALKNNFEEQNPNISLKYSGYPYGELKKQVLIMANAGQSPDVIQSSRSWYSSFVDGGYLASLNDLLPTSYLDDIYPEILKDMKVDGQVYGVPWKASPFVLFYNKALFSEAGLDPNKAPKTYEEALQMSKKLSKLTDKDGNAVYAMGQTTGAVPVSGGAILSMMYSFGGGLYDSDGNVAINTPANKKAFETLKEMHKKGYNPDGAKLKDLRNLFAIGRLGMYFDQLWGMTGAYAINPDLKKSVGVTNPLSGNGAASGSTLEAHMLLISEDSKYKKEAAKFIEFATSPKEIGQYYEITPFLLSTKSQVEANPEYSTDPGIKPVLDYAKTIHSVAKHPEMENVFLSLTNAAQSVTVGDISVEDTLSELDKIIKNQLK